jgi:hypothetical protein
MKKETKSKLDILTAKYKKKIEEENRIRVEKKIEEDIFLSEFFEVLEEEESVDHEGRTQDAKIIMNVFPAGIDRSLFRHKATPRISFHATKYKMEIWIYTSTIMPKRGGQAGSGGEFKLEEINTDLVEQKALELLTEIFDRKW